ncbi:MAG TPA: nicotinate (nicotinamide) nucleotide adenylyltransferase [Nitrospirales bacterium]|nr:nicotinate (nicotinamide) nucleotide adenylyltransferase [Nitrospirales bacterium]
MSLGLLGGTFDPIHVGHLAIAQEIIDRKLCDRILFIPAGFPPHRQNSVLTPIKHRHEMVRLAIADNPAFQISDIEIDGPSYSYQTVEAMRTMHDENTGLSFIIGLDNLFDLPNWREPQRIIKACDLIVVSRPGWAFESMLEPQYSEFFGLNIELQYIEALDAGTCNELVIHPKPGTDHSRSITLLRTAGNDVSASKIRASIAEKQELHTLLPAPVESYILSLRLYTTERIHPES